MSGETRIYLDEINTFAAVNSEDIVVTASSPGRAGILGNPSDMYGGAVLSCSISERAHCVLSKSSKLIVCIENESAEFSSESDYELRGDNFDIIRAVFHYFEIDPRSFHHRLDLHTDIPVSAGLSGSTALIISAVGCILEIMDKKCSPYEIAETARRIEAEVMHMTCGFQDAYMSVFGGLNFVDLHGKDRLLGVPTEPYATVEPLGQWLGDLPFILAHSGVRRVSGTVHRPIRERWLSGEPEVVAAYERIADLARAGKAAMLEGDWQRVGDLMNENHDIQRSLGGSGSSNEQLISAALANGASGAKLAGAGHGGTIIALTFDPDKTAAALLEAGAKRILHPKAVAGLTVERCST